MCISPTSVYTANKSTGQLTPEGTNHIPVVTGSLEGEREGEREGGREEGREGGWRTEGREERDGGRERGRGREREGGRETYNIQLYNHVHVHT